MISRHVFFGESSLVLSYNPQDGTFTMSVTERNSGVVGICSQLEIRGVGVEDLSSLADAIKYTEYELIKVKTEA